MRTACAASADWGVADGWASIRSAALATQLPARAWRRSMATACQRVCGAKGLGLRSSVHGGWSLRSKSSTSHSTS